MKLMENCVRTPHLNVQKLWIFYQIIDNNVPNYARCWNCGCECLEIIISHGALWTNMTLENIDNMKIVLENIDNMKIVLEESDVRISLTTPF